MALPFRSLPNLASADFPQREHPQSGHYDIAPAQQMFEQYGLDSMSVSTWQVQSFGGPAVTMQPFVPPTLYPSHEQFHNGFLGNKPSTILPKAPKAPMLPKVPQKPMRKRKAATLHAADWEPYRKRILELHIKQNRSVHEVKQMMEAENGFKAEVRQYRSRISQWGHDKNVKRHEMQAIVRKHQKRKLMETDKRPLVFEVRGNEVDRQKIERWMKRHDASDSFLYEPDPAAPTPPAVGCRTMSERGSPVPTTITVYSGPASVISMDDAEGIAQKPQMLSSGPSLSGIVRSQTDVLAEQTPVLTRQAHPSLQLSFLYNQRGFTSAGDNSVQVLYRRDEEIRLRGDLIIADLTVLSDVPEVLVMMYIYGQLLLDQGRYSAAEEVGWRLIDARKCQLCDGSEPVRMMHASKLLETALLEQRAWDKAELVLQRALQSTDFIGRNHADKSELLDSLGQLLNHQNKVAEAEAMYRQSLDIKERYIGREHPSAINTAVRLGILLQKRGRLDEAEAILSKTLALSEKVLEVEDLSTLLNMSSLVELLASRYGNNESEEMFRRILTLEGKMYGRAHLRTIRRSEDLAALLFAQHRYTEAGDLYREALVVRTQVLGSEHPYTLWSMSKLGRVLCRQNRYEEAEAMYTEKLALCKKVLGSEHPDTLINMEILGHVLYMQDKYEEAEAMDTEILALRKKVLGSEHPDTLHNMSNLGHVLYMQSRYEEAEAMYTETLALHKKVLGSEHPDTLQSIEDLQRSLERR
ncbi:hypothetical protein E8E13_008418 [Curvularia kusanoi]|uniref:Clr5 domain-containing protein n=1 Tax=Curvularia kusanoi TaxID=90978 RepID=A0A9P4TCG9_CURKU|nr:hypothetical protein E8E13_008418 [Curvularia kusanoi]